MSQMSFSDCEYAGKRKQTRRERFLAEMEQAVTVQELNWMLDGFDLWRNRPHQVLTPRFVA
ncbi:hypothetical protein [Pseudomonas fluorescens]|uniref:hypothetical protein n=1 Tax=Pseudomonas fluorescens TaxID=294 RepID=UPI000371EBC5|nr:hypothetical protein [Pseudomonas fluorescens]